MQRYFALTKENNYLTLTPSDIHHIKNVMRMDNDDIVECIYEEKVYKGKVDLNTKKIKIINEIKENNELNIDITIAVGLVKEQKMDLILQKLTELGVKKIIPVIMERSIVKLDKNKYAKKKERWHAICKEASEQSKRNIIPEVCDIIPLTELKNIKADKKIVCNVKEENNLINKCLQKLNNYAKILVVIGPEGGISDKEIELLKTYNFESVSLGNRIMRVETATIYIMSIINFCSMK